MIKTLEKRIRTLIRQIDKNVLTPKDSGIGRLFNKLKTLDEPLYMELLKEYKNILNK